MKSLHTRRIFSPDSAGQSFADNSKGRKKINELMEQGRLMSYALSDDYSRLWCVVRAESEFEVMSLVSEFPLIDYMDPKITKLMFNNVVALRLPMFSLN